MGSAATTASTLFSAFPAVSAATPASAFDWTPPASSPIATGGLATFATDARIQARAAGFIVPTAYRGAAAPGGAKWWANWTNYARN